MTDSKILALELLKQDLELLGYGRDMWKWLGQNPGMAKKNYLLELNSPEVSKRLGSTQCAGCVIACKEQKKNLHKESKFSCTYCPLLTAGEKETVIDHGFACCSGDYHKWDSAAIVARHTRAIKLIKNKISRAEKSK